MSGTDKPLRFAAMVRVSSEVQEKYGESLATQRKYLAEDVDSLGGTIARWYGGQEHATPGWEKKELNRLLADAGKDKFDAVIVAYADRWSRDNRKSKEAFQILRQHGVRFFVRTNEQFLFDPAHRFHMGIQAEVGEFIATQQLKKSIECRIERARKGMPAAGKLPFGRTYHKETGWAIIPEKQALIQDVARRYLEGEPLPDLASEYGINHPYLHKVLTKRCGSTWEQEFHAEELNIHERVTISIPPLLPPETIAAIHQMAEARKTYLHGQRTHPYLLSRMVFCAHCGYAMFGQTNRNGKRYYRHAHMKRVHPCPARRRYQAWINADNLETAVFRDLFDMFGNPAAVQRAIEEATPNKDKIAETRARLENLGNDLKQTRTGRERLLKLVVKGTITEEEAEKQLTKLKDQETRQQQEMERLRERLANIPDPETVQAAATQIVATVSGKGLPYDDAGAERDLENQRVRMLSGMTWEEKRKLAEMVFSGKTEEKRMGVYVEWVEGQEARRRKQWQYKIAGHFVLCGGTTPAQGDWEPAGAPLQQELLRRCGSEAVSKSLGELDAHHGFGVHQR
jgi:DNA invertase Pin-like site-specific DNA recombinase